MSLPTHSRDSWMEDGSRAARPWSTDTAVANEQILRARRQVDAVDRRRRRKATFSAAAAFALFPYRSAPLRRSRPERRFGGATERPTDDLSAEKRRQRRPPPNLARSFDKKRAKATELAAARIAGASSAAQQPPERRSPLPNTGRHQILHRLRHRRRRSVQRAEGNGAFRIARPPRSRRIGEARGAGCAL